MMLRFLLIFLSVLCSVPARSAEIAVIDFRGYGVSFDDAALVSQGFRDAFLEEGKFFPLEGYDISDRLSSNYEDDLSRARSLVSEARDLLNRSKAQDALVLLEEAEIAHKRAGSLFGRQSQIADVYFYLGQAQLRLGRSTLAQEAFLRMFAAYPDYDTARAGRVSASVTSSMSRAKSEWESGNPTLLSIKSASAIARRLRVAAVVVGTVESNGSIRVRLSQDGQVKGDVRRQVSEIPPFPGDPIYTEMVSELLGSDSGSVGNSSSFSSGSDSSNKSDFADAPSFANGSFDSGSAPTENSGRQEGPSDSPGLPDSLGKDFVPWWKFWERDKKTAPLNQINVGGVREPITQQWWFWAATGAVVVGGGTAAVIVLSDKEPDPDSPSNADTSTSYTLSIATD